MKYKVGQKFRIKTFEEVTRDAPRYSWNVDFFQINGNKIFTIHEINVHPIHAEYYEHKPDVTIYGNVEGGAGNVVLNTREQDDIILKLANHIELDNDLFEI